MLMLLNHCLSKVAEVYASTKKTFLLKGTLEYFVHPNMFSKTVRQTGERRTASQHMNSMLLLFADIKLKEKKTQVYPIAGPVTSLVIRQTILHPLRKLLTFTPAMTQS